MKKTKLVFLLTVVLGLFGLMGFATKVQADGSDMYRLYNPNTSEHLYTINSSERTWLIRLGWKDEGIGWTAPKTGNQVLRLYNPNSGEHLYTLDRTEYNSLGRLGWKQEGLAFYSSTTKDVPVYRLYNSNATSFNHHYSYSSSERDWLRTLGWRYEGIAFYGTQDSSVITTYTVTIKFVDADGKAVNKTETSILNAGVNQTFTAPSIKGYKVKGSLTQSVENIKADKTLTFTYEKTDDIQYTVTVDFVNSEGTSLRTSQKVVLNKGDDFTANAPKISNYYLSGEASQSITNVEKDTTITFKYWSEGEIFKCDVEDGGKGYVIGLQDNRPVKDIVIPSSFVLDGQEYPILRIADGAFDGVALNSVTIPNSVTTIGKRAFAETGLTAVTLGSGVTTIGERAFTNNNLTSVKIPDSVTQIDFDGFAYNQIETLTLGKNLTTLGQGAFYTNNLTTVTMPDKLVNFGEYAFAKNKLTAVEVAKDSVYAANTFDRDVKITERTK